LYREFDSNQPLETHFFVLPLQYFMVPQRPGPTFATFLPFFLATFFLATFFLATFFFTTFFLATAFFFA
jgi:hypothetical protein